MSESGPQSVIQCESRFGKCDLERERDCGFMASRSEQNANTYNNLSNNPLALQGGGRNEGVLCKAESPMQNKNGIVSPIISNEKLPREIRFPSPDCHSASTVLSASNISLSYFADPTVPEDKEESAEIASINANKYFSTPLPSIGRVKKKLTPVMEVDCESNISEEGQHQDQVSTTEMLHKNFVEVLANESPTKTLLYRSFFAAECQEIVNQIESRETDVSPGKRKAEAFEVSTIDAEPPPYDWTPMKSMLACEVTRVIPSVESSPVKEGLSLFGESLLDLEKTDLQLTDFNLSECGFKNGKDHSVNGADRLDGMCIKRLKTEPLEKMDQELNHVNQMSPLPNILNHLKSETPTMESLQVCAPSKCGHETAAPPSNVLDTDHKLSDNGSGPAVLMQDTAVVRHISPVITASPQALISPKNGVPDEAALSCVVLDYGSCSVSVTCLNYQELPPTDATQLSDGSKASTNVKPQRVASEHGESIANSTQVIDIIQTNANSTQDIPFIQEEINIANSTKVIEMEALPSGSTTQDIISMPGDTGNNTHVIDVPLSANATHDIIPTHEGVTPQLPLDTSQEPTSVHESGTTNTTYPIEAMPQPCINTTMDIAPVDDPALPANTTQVMESAPQDVAQPSLNVCHAPAQESLVISDPNHSGTTGTNTEQEVTEGHQLEGYETKIACTEIASCPKEEDTGIETNQPLMLENCSMIQEEEISQDVSVFSTGSLSFVTSTPVTGLNPFQFQKTCKDSVRQDHNLSICSVLDESTNRVPGELRMIPQQKSHEAQGLYCKDKGKPAEASRGSGLPLNMQRSMVLPSEVVPKAMPSASGIPSARRSLALHQSASSHNPAVSKIAQRSAIPGRGMIRAPLVRQSLPRASLGNPKQAIEAPGGSSITNKLAGNRFRTPKAAAVLKPRSAATHAPLPTAPSSIKPPSRLGAPSTIGRLSVGVQNAAANPHGIPSGETVSVVRPPVATVGIKTGLPRPGTSSLRLPLPQSQKVSPKYKSQGLPAKKSQQELPVSRRKIGPKAESSSVVRSSANLSLEISKEVASFQVGLQASSSPSHEKVQSSESLSIPAISTELAESGLEGCRHLQVCNCCCARYQQLLQENEDLKRRLGQVQYTQAELTDIAGT